MAVYTSGDWHAKPGREQELVAAWQDLADWTDATHNPGGSAKLLQDADDPTHFVSFGEWRDAQVVEEWRASEGFKQRLATIRELVDEMSIRSFDHVAEQAPVTTRA